MNRLFAFAAWIFAFAHACFATTFGSHSLTNRQVFATEHLDFRITYDPSASTNEALGLAVHHSPTNIATTNVLLLVRESAKLEIPPGFDVFGDEGSPLWILPQSQNPDLLYLGFSAENLPRSAFNGNLTIHLLSKTGPGHFFVWQADSSGNLDFRFNTRDGISPEDSGQPIVGSHEHFNFGFSSNGLYEVVLQATAIRQSDSAILSSPPIPVVFAVEPYSFPDHSGEAVRLQVPVFHLDGSITTSATGTPGPLEIQISTDLLDWKTHQLTEIPESGTSLPIVLPQTARIFVRAIRK